MKKLILLSTLFFMTFALFGQDLKWEDAADEKTEKTKRKPALSKPAFEAAPTAANIREGVLGMSLGSHPGYSMVLDEISEKEVKSLWKSLMKEYDSKPKRVKKSDDMLAQEVRISSITGTGAMNIYSQTVKSGNGVEMTVWFDMGDGKFLNSRDYSNSTKDAERFLNSFAVRVKKASIQNELDDEEKALASLRKELKSLAKKKSNLEKDIENYKKKITEAEQSITGNEGAQAETEAAIKEQEMKVQDVAHKLRSTH